MCLRAIVSFEPLSIDPNLRPVWKVDLVIPQIHILQADHQFVPMRLIISELTAEIALTINFAADSPLADFAKATNCSNLAA